MPKERQLRRQPSCRFLLANAIVRLVVAMVRRYSATYDAEKAARAHERFSPADRMGERLG